MSGPVPDDLSPLAAVHLLDQVQAEVIEKGVAAARQILAAKHVVLLPGLERIIRGSLQMGVNLTMDALRRRGYRGPAS